jgi:hypothetical protein
LADDNDVRRDGADLIDREAGHSLGLWPSLRIFSRTNSLEIAADVGCTMVSGAVIARRSPGRSWVGFDHGANAMRSVLALGLLITLCVSADAATVRRSKPPEAHSRPAQRVTIPERATVPGWTDEQTRRWLSKPEVTE